MLTDSIKQNILKNELHYHTSRSGGKGGQHVNKVETKVTITFFIEKSSALNQQQKTTILKKRDGLLNPHFIQISSSKNRTQIGNKLDAQKKLFSLLTKLLKPEVKRIATKASKSSIERKLKSKKLNSEKKERRKKFDS